MGRIRCAATSPISLDTHPWPRHKGTPRSRPKSEQNVRLVTMKPARVDLCLCLTLSGILKEAFVYKYALFAALTSILSCWVFDRTNAITLSDGVSAWRTATNGVTQLEQVRWLNGQPIVSCNLRIPCPFSHHHLGRHYGPHGQSGLAEPRRDSYRPCPASVEFPNGRHACLP
jgi:hypothetical protein